MQCCSGICTCDHGGVLDVGRLLFDSHAPAQWAILVQYTLVAPPAACNHMHAFNHVSFFSMQDWFEEGVLRRQRLYLLEDCMEKTAVEKMV